MKDHKKLNDLLEFKSIRLFIREILSEDSSAKDSAKSLTYKASAGITGFLSPMSQRAIDYYSKKFSSSKRDTPLFLVKITHNFDIISSNGKLLINGSAVDDFKMLDSLTPTYVEDMLTLQEVKNSSLSLAGSAVDGVENIDLNKTFKLADYISFDEVSSDKPAYLVEVTLEAKQTFTGKLGYEFEIPKFPDGSYAVPANLVLDNPAQYGLFLGKPESSRYSKEPYERYCGTPEEDPDCVPLRPHYGVDLSRLVGPSIGAPIVAPTGGLVYLKPDHGQSGNMILMKHDDGSHTKYLHLSKYAEIKDGGRAEAGQIIGYLGTTGRSTAPHLHFETFPPGGDPEDNNATIDPAIWLRDNDAWFPVTSNTSKMK